ncbi:hypothetical protein P692DRAFT_20717641, partial [Suillus brevipes Sb2]
VNRFTNLADESHEVPTLRNKTYDNFKLDRSDWRHLGLIHRVLKEPATAQQSSMALDPQYLPIADAIKAGLKNVDKYFKKTSQSDVYFICLVLDPNYKLAYVEGRWDSEDVAGGRARLEAVVSTRHVLCCFPPLILFLLVR